MSQLTILSLKISLFCFNNFHQFSHKILSGRLTERNYELIAKLVDEFHVIRSAMKIIETKQGDFRA